MVELERKIALLCPAPTRLGLQRGFTFDTGEELLYDKESKAIKLTLKERRFLALLAKTPNIIVSLHAIEDYVWEGEETSLSSIRSLVKRLRGKLGEESIETQNYGYRLLVPYM
jgi:DNA-binding response OmpR family regulator